MTSTVQAPGLFDPAVVSAGARHPVNPAGRRTWTAQTAAPATSGQRPATSVDRPRLAGHNAALLARLRRGPVTNAELWASPELFGRAINSRVSDVRQFLESTTGQTIESIRLPAGPSNAAGTWRYRIVAKPLSTSFPAAVTAAAPALESPGRSAVLTDPTRPADGGPRL